MTGATEEECLKNLGEVLRRFQEVGVHLKREKCTLQAREMAYLGYRVDAQGLHPMEDKVRAIKEAPAPKNAPELKLFLGMVNYYGCFLLNLLTLLAPFHVLLKKHQKQLRKAPERAAFCKVKQLLSLVYRYILSLPKGETPCWISQSQLSFVGEEREQGLILDCSCQVLTQT
ncbi:uncharacterized protein LOC144502036 [Mustelus asterias]